MHYSPRNKKDPWEKYRRKEPLKSTGCIENAHIIFMFGFLWFGMGLLMLSTWHTSDWEWPYTFWGTWKFCAWYSFIALLIGRGTASLERPYLSLNHGRTASRWNPRPENSYEVYTRKGLFLGYKFAKDSFPFGDKGEWSSQMLWDGDPEADPYWSHKEYSNWEAKQHDAGAYPNYLSARQREWDEWETHS